MLHADEQDLDSQLKRVSIAHGDSLYHPGEPIDHAYFIESGIASVVVSMADGRTVEVGMIGFEGLLGFGPLLGRRLATVRVIARSRCEALAMKTSRCKAAFEADRCFQGAVLRFVSSFISMLSRTAACNQLHTIEQRCARWLLMASDRLETETVPMTQEFSAMMLGVRRAGVTVVAGRLRDMGLIDYRQGSIRILDRHTLESFACECYAGDYEQFATLIKD